MLKERPLPKDKRPEELCPKPDLFIIDYRDGLRTSVLTWSGDYHVQEWAAAWRYADRDESAAAVFWTQEWRPFMHFTPLLRGVEQMVHTGKPSWPVERTLLTTGMLDALLISRRDGSKVIETPQLSIQYQTPWRWQEPPPPPKNRPIEGE